MSGDSSNSNHSQLSDERMAELLSIGRQTEVETRIIKKIGLIFSVITVILAIAGYIGFDNVVRKYAEKTIKSELESVSNQTKIDIANNLSEIKKELKQVSLNTRLEMEKYLLEIREQLAEISLRSNVEMDEYRTDIKNDLKKIATKSMEGMDDYLEEIKKKSNKQQDEFTRTLSSEKNQLFNSLTTDSYKYIDKNIMLKIDSKIDAQMKLVLEKKYNENISDQVDYAVKTELSKLLLKSNIVDETIKEKIKIANRDNGGSKKNISRNVVKARKDIISNDYVIQIASNKRYKQIVKVWNKSKNKNRNNIENLKLCTPNDKNGTFLIVSYPPENGDFKEVQYYRDKYFPDAKAVRISNLNKYHDCLTENPE